MVTDRRMTGNRLGGLAELLAGLPSLARLLACSLAHLLTCCVWHKLPNVPPFLKAPPLNCYFEPCRWNLSNEPVNPGDDSGDVMQVRWVLAAWHRARLACNSHTH